MERNKNICPRQNWGLSLVCDERRDRLTKKRLEMVESPSNVESKLVRLENRHFFTQIKILKKEFLPCKAFCTVGKKSAKDFWHVHKDWSTVKIFQHIFESG